MSQSDRGVVDLPGAGVPADNGLSSLGLIMQLGGTLFTAAVSIYILGQVMLTATVGRYAGGDGLVLWTIAGGSICVARSLLHRSAGNGLLYKQLTPSGDGASPLGPMKRYIVFGLVASALVAAILDWKFGMTHKAAIGFGVGLAAWPAVLGGMLLGGRFRSYEVEIPLAEDKGFESAAVLMTLMGLCGVFATGAGLVLFMRMGGQALQGVNALIIITTLVLFVRSCLHAHAGISGLRETSIDRSVELANRYANFGVISSFCACGAILMFFMTVAFSFFSIVPIAGLCWMLMAWPLIVRRFFADRQFVDLLANGETVHRRAPDAGLTGLGWFLLAHSMFGAVNIIPSILGTEAAGRELGIVAMAFNPHGAGVSIWWDVVVWVLQAWAGFELVRMSPLHRIVGTVYGVGAAAITLYTTWPELKAMNFDGAAGTKFVIYAFLAISLLLPIATTLLVNRNLAPTARARYRSAATP